MPTPICRMPSYRWRTSSGVARHSSSRVSCCSKNSPLLNSSMPLRSSGGAGAAQAASRSAVLSRSSARSSLGCIERGSDTRTVYCPVTQNATDEGSRTMKFASVQELLQGTRQVVDLNGGVRVKNPATFRAETIDRLIHTAVFGDPDARTAARWLIWEAGWDLGIQSASIDRLYQARARNEYEGLTVPAINVRAMAYDMARAIVASAQRRGVGAFIFELARSEMEYTDQTCDEFATVMMAASIKEGHKGPLFIQGDHYQANAKKYATDPQGVIDGLRKLIGEAIQAGYGNIDIDTSTLVDLSFPTVKEQQKHNYERCAELASLIRQQEQPGVTISIGGGVGGGGKKNSTVEGLRAFVEGVNEGFGGGGGQGVPGLSKISVNTGST